MRAIANPAFDGIATENCCALIGRVEAAQTPWKINGMETWTKKKKANSLSGGKKRKKYLQKSEK
ncbi:MAG: hypothetical protein F6K14_19600 [Symploca sp. SIO2C1]|nr:hypothetical protein [Symploca sp. SIO2C1]